MEISEPKSRVLIVTPQYYTSLYANSELKSLRVTFVKISAITKNQEIGTLCI